MTTTNLSAKVAEFKRLCEQRQETVVQKSLIRTGTSAIVESPVDQGRFVAGWNFAFGAEDTSIRDGEFSGEAERMGSINRLTSTLSGIELGMVFYFSNPLPYAQRLEQGWSAKSSLMVARAVNNFPAIVAEEVSKAK
jgi:hypothetical protein